MDGGEQGFFDLFGGPGGDAVAGGGMGFALALNGQPMAMPIGVGGLDLMNVPGFAGIAAGLAQLGGFAIPVTVANDGMNPGQTNANAENFVPTIVPCSHFVEEARLVIAANLEGDAPGQVLQTESLLLSRLPAELLGMISSYVNPRASAEQPRSSPANFFATCKLLLALSRLASTRASFLVATFGIPEIGDGVGTWLRITTPTVLEAVLGRAVKTDPVPRFQLQRLQRRINFTGRSDLAAPLITYMERVYPHPVSILRSPSSFPFGGSASTITDDELFRLLITWNKVPAGCESLVLEALEAGYAVDSDAVLSACLTLVNKYRLSVSHTVGGRSVLSLAFDAITSQPTQSSGLPGPTNAQFSVPTQLAVDPRRDTGVPGTDASHALLIHKAAQGDELAVSRLLHLGCSTGLPVDAFWKSINALGWKSTSLEQHQRSHPENSVRAISAILGSAAPAQAPTSPCPPISLLDTLCVRYGIASPYVSVRMADGGSRVFLDAVEAAAAGGRVNVLRELLDVEGGRGRWDEDEGKECLGRCLDLCKDNTECYNLVRGYATAVQSDKSVELLSALLANDSTLANSLVAAGATITVTQYAVVLRTASAADSRPLLFSLCTLDINTLEALLKMLIPSGGLGHGHLQPDAHLVASVRALLEHYTGNGLMLSKKKGKALLSRTFDRATEGWKVVLRSFMGTVEEVGLGSRVAEWDLRRAVVAGDGEAVREIHVKGVRVPITPDLLGNVRPSTAATQTGLLALLNVQNGTQAERTRLLSESIYMMADEIATFLLEKNAVADSMALLECLNRGQGAEELWGRLLERAGKQESIVGRVGSIEHLVRALGGDWEERWKVYKAKFDGTEE